MIDKSAVLHVLNEAKQHIEKVGWHKNNWHEFAIGRSFYESPCCMGYAVLLSEGKYVDRDGEVNDNWADSDVIDCLDYSLNHSSSNDNRMFYSVDEWNDEVAETVEDVYRLFDNAMMYIEEHDIYSHRMRNEN